MTRHRPEIKDHCLKSKPTTSMAQAILTGVRRHAIKSRAIIASRRHGHDQRERQRGNGVRRSAREPTRFLQYSCTHPITGAKEVRK